MLCLFFSKPCPALDHRSAHFKDEVIEHPDQQGMVHKGDFAVGFIPVILCIHHILIRSPIGLNK